MVKVFSCIALGGAQYIKELLGPLDNIPLVPVGGVTLENVVEYFQAGASGVWVGISLFWKQAVTAKNWDLVSQNVQQFVARCTVA